MPGPYVVPWTRVPTGGPRGSGDPRSKRKEVPWGWVGEGFRTRCEVRWYGLPGAGRGWRPFKTRPPLAVFRSLLCSHLPPRPVRPPVPSPATTVILYDQGKGHFRVLCRRVQRPGHESSTPTDPVFRAPDPVTLQWLEGRLCHPPS